MISNDGYIGSYKGINVVGLSYKEYEEKFASDRIERDVIYWINNFGTLVHKHNVIGKMDKTGKIINCDEPFFFGNILREPYWGNWTIPSLRDEYYHRQSQVGTSSQGVQEDNSNFEVKKSDEALPENKVKISLDSEIDLSKMSEKIDRFLEEAANIDWSKKVGSVGE
jgi:hypothetical protein